VGNFDDVFESINYLSSRGIVRDGRKKSFDSCLKCSGLLNESKMWSPSIFRLEVALNFQVTSRTQHRSVLIVIPT
jgi:hypothetical protein